MKRTKGFDPPLSRRGGHSGAQDDQRAVHGEQRAVHGDHHGVHGDQGGARDAPCAALVVSEHRARRLVFRRYHQKPGRGNDPWLCRVL